MAFIPMGDAAKLLRLPEGAQGVRMKLNDIFTAPIAAEKPLLFLLSSCSPMIGRRRTAIYLVQFRWKKPWLVCYYF